MTDEATPLKVYLPGSCAQLVPALQEAFSRQTGAPAFSAAKVDQTGKLAEAIIEGADADVLMSANVAYVDQVEAAGLIGHRRLFARNALCILVRENQANRIHGVPDLMQNGVRTLLCPSGADPCGQYTVAMFERVGLQDELIRLRADGTIRELAPGVSFDLLASGDVDAIVIYRSFASRIPDLHLIELDLPYSMADQIVFAAGAISRNGQQHRDARAFVDFLAGPAAQEILKGNDFLALEN